MLDGWGDEANNMGMLSCITKSDHAPHPTGGDLNFEFQPDAGCQ